MQVTEAVSQCCALEVSFSRRTLRSDPMGPPIPGFIHGPDGVTSAANGATAPRRRRLLVVCWYAAEVPHAGRGRNASRLEEAALASREAGQSPQTGCEAGRPGGGSPTWELQDGLLTLSAESCVRGTGPSRTACGSTVSGSALRGGSGSHRTSSTQPFESYPSQVESSSCETTRRRAK